MAKFCTLFSGSSGNCTYIESGGAALLIDAGMSARSICRALNDIGSDIKNVAGIFVTHEHSDHIKGLAVLSSKYHLPIFANPGTIRGILSTSGCSRMADSDFQVLDTGDGTEIAGMYIASFATSHDSNESVGYRVHTSDGKVLAVATDLGYVSSTVMQNITGCSLVMIESNHDVNMLLTGGYPYYLKRRILSQRGHLSNDDCAAVLPSLVEAGTVNFILGHLSHENNLPLLAEQTANAQLQMSGISSGDYKLLAAPRFEPSDVLSI